jgi:hypothetical protein
LAAGRISFFTVGAGFAVSAGVSASAAAAVLSALATVSAAPALLGEETAAVAEVFDETVLRDRNTIDMPDITIAPTSSPIPSME